MLRIARERIRSEPDRYLDHIYGEKEVGGTNVFYLTCKNVQFAALGLPDFEYKAVSGLTESIQHRIFQYFIPPIAVYSILGGIMAYNQRRKKNAGIEGRITSYNVCYTKLLRSWTLQNLMFCINLLKHQKGL